MSRSQIVATNEAVLRALGIDQPLITAVQIHMQPNELPMVTIERLLSADAMQTTVQDFDLILRDDGAPAPAARPALDLDAMCAAARTRLAAQVGWHASIQLADQLHESSAIRTRMATAIRTHKEDTAQAMLRTHTYAWVSQLAANGGVFAGAVSGLAGVPAFAGLSALGGTQ